MQHRGLIALLGLAGAASGHAQPRQLLTPERPSSSACPLDCSLNGVCSDGVCTCDLPWTGEHCDRISVAPALPGGIYGYAPNVSSWGGNSVLGDDGQWHLFVAEMATGGLKGWGHYSECTHAVGASQQGPFRKVQEALPMWCHNPFTVRDPKDGTYYLFHIGSGNDTRSADFMHYSKSPYGPWTAAATKPSSCNNPAPMFHPNGTLFLVCSHNYISRASSHPLDPANVYHTHQMVKTGAPNDPDRHWEDPSLWFDRRGNWHVLYHVYCLLPYAKHKECMSGHAYSTDGFNWIYSNTEPFNGTVTFTDGSPAITFSTRERPHVVFATNDVNQTTPIGVTSGVSSQQPNPSCDSCQDQACSQCKITSGRDWTYTVLQPFKGSLLA